MRAGRDRVESRDQLERVAALDEAGQLGELFLEQGRIDVHRRRAPDLRVRGRSGLLAVGPQLLVQLLTRAGADELDRDVPARLLAGEANHVVREVEDLHRLAHVEHEDVTRLADRAGLDDQLRSLRDRHEVPGHLADG